MASSVAAGIFLAVGLNLLERDVGRPNEDALALFAVWWVSLAIYAGAGASSDLTAALGVEAAGIFVLLGYVQMISFTLGLWGLVYYVVYTLTGRRNWRVPLAVGHAVYYGVVIFLLTLGQPFDVVLRDSGVQLVPQAPLVNAGVLSLLLIFPALVISATYLGLLSIARNASQRLRVVLITASTLAWMLAMVASEGAVVTWSASLPPVLALVSAWCVTWAYHPPRWIRRRFSPVDEPERDATG